MSSSSTSTKLSPRADDQNPGHKTPSRPYKNQPSPSVFPPVDDFLPISPIRPCSSPVEELPFQQYDHKENSFEETNDNQAKYCSTPSPLRHVVGNDDMRHHLLVQRTFNVHDDHAGPTTSSPLRKSPNHASPSFPTLTVPRSASKDYCFDGWSGGSTPHSIFKTPVRGQHRERDLARERTPSTARTPCFASPASSMYAFTPGRQFVNPFELDHERLHMPLISPGMFPVKKTVTESSDDNGREGFWTLEQRAMLMPVEIEEWEMKRQHFHQTKRDKELDPHFQKAIDQYFASGLIVPSPWSEKGQRFLPQTPSGVKSVSCQTSMSVPPDVDFVAEVGEKYQLPDSQLMQESPVDLLAGGVIRRKLLHQLNENDSIVVGASPILPRKSHDVQNSSSSPSPTKQVTPELEKQTPNKKSSGHFSSSPIRLSGDKVHHPAMSESDLLASPELSPIAGRGSHRPMRSSDVFSPHQELERSREIMQLDFSSILDEPDEFDNDLLSEKTGTPVCVNEVLTQGQPDIVHNGSSEFPEQNTQSTCNLSHIITDEVQPSSFDKSSHATRKALLTSGLSAESTQDMATTIQDTGYQTASLQSITNINSASNLNPDIYPSTSSANQSLNLTTHAKAKTMQYNCDPSFNKNLSLHSSFTKQFSSLPFKSEVCMEEGNSLDSYLSSGSRLSSLFSDTTNNPSKPRNVCRVRKIRTLADIRRSKEKSSASRDLTSSFNEEAKSSSTIVRLSRSLSNPSLNMDISTSAAESSPNLVLTNEKPVSGSPPISRKCAKPIFSLEEGINSGCVSVTGEGGINQTHENPIRALVNLDKRPFENIGNKPELEPGEIQNEHKYIRLLPDGKEDSKENVFCPVELKQRFSLEDKSTLQEARELLGKSEALRMQHDSDSKGHLELDELFQYMTETDPGETRTVRSDGDVQTQGNAEADDEGDRKGKLINAMPFTLHPVRMSTPDYSMFESMEEKIASIEGAKLGSEIAAEILKRAGDDLAQLTSSGESASNPKPTDS